MERYELRIKRSAVKELERLGTRKERRQLVSRIARLAEEPRPTGCAKLGGREGYRTRQGPYRVVYTVGNDARVVEIFRVAHRRDAYGR